MEWKVLFFQSLLMLLVASQLTNACTCKMLRLEEAMCPGQGKTVVRAAALSVERLNRDGNVVDAEEYAPNARYKMRLKRTFANGGTPLNVKNSIFTMMFPLADNMCGHIIPLHEDYLIVGNVYESGMLSSNKCQLVLPMGDVNDDINSILNGNVALNCSDP